MEYVFLIKIFKIKDVKYEILQTLKFHRNYIYKILEPKNKSLVSCSSDSSIIFYYKDNLEYKINYKIKTNGLCSFVIQTKDNEIFIQKLVIMQYVFMI